MYASFEKFEEALLLTQQGKCIRENDKESVTCPKRLS